MATLAMITVENEFTTFTLCDSPHTCTGSGPDSWVQSGAMPALHNLTLDSSQLKGNLLES